MCPLTVVIPTWRRERVLLDTLDYLLALTPPPAEILVVDQTEQHEAATAQRLETLHAVGSIRWLRLAHPSITAAMNHGLLQAQHAIVLFVDDDIRPEPDLLTAHLSAHARMSDVLVAGRVIQPWDAGKDFTRLEQFSFAGLEAGWITEFIGCNFSVNRTKALELGGFDENFVRVAYRYEAEFSHRFLVAGCRIYFEPAACLHHLKELAGGTRSYGDHLTTYKPDHAVGAYYFALRTQSLMGCLKAFVSRLLQSVFTRYHLRHPWRMPATLLAEVRGLCWALRLARSGPRLIHQHSGTTHV